MPQKGDTQINTFVGGLITEASPLSFPQGASLDEINMNLKRDGSRQRRLGLDYEENNALIASGFTADGLKEARQRFFRWVTPSGSVKVEIGVIQVGNTLHFIDLLTDAPSENTLNGGSPVTLTTNNEVVFEFTIINNKLLVVAEDLETPYLLTYDDDLDVISTETGRITIRDIYGVQDDLALDERPVVLTDTHEYNIRNQGWSSNISTTCGTDPIICTKSTLGVYPSNADIWTLGREEDTASADIDKYDPNILVKNSFDLGRAARGHYIIDLYNRGASRAGSTPVDRELGRVSTAATYAGRIFYSGIRSRIVGGDDFSAELSSAVLYTQVMESNDDLFKCYQKADPTSSEQSDLVDTDGGVVAVSGAVNIVKLIPVKSSLFIFASNGVWEIKGDDGGFKATAFQVSKISSIGVFSRDSIVEANGTIIFWAKEGIFALAPEQVSGEYGTTNLTISTIQTLYNSIPNLQKQNARGYYDISENTIRWLYGSDDVKLLGDPIDIQDPPNPFQFSTCQAVPFTYSITHVDNETLSSSETVIIAASVSTGNEGIYGMVADIDDFNATFNTEYLLDNSIITYTHVSVVSLTQHLIIIGAIDTTNNKVYAISCSVIGGVITKLNTTLIGNTNTLNVAVKAMRVDDTHAVIAYNATPSNGLAVVAVESVGTTLNIGTPTIINTYTGSIGAIDIETTDVAGTFHATGRTGNSHYGQIPFSVSGLVVTAIPEFPSIGLYSGTLQIPITYLSSSSYIVCAQNITSGTKVAAVSSFAGGNIDTIITTDTTFHDDIDVTVGGNKVVTLYTSTSGYVEMEVFRVDALGLLVSEGVHRLCSEHCRDIFSSNVGFTNTKFPVTYINSATFIVQLSIIETGKV